MRLLLTGGEKGEVIERGGRLLVGRRWNGKDSKWVIELPLEDEDEAATLVLVLEALGIVGDGLVAMAGKCGATEFNKFRKEE